MEIIHPASLNSPVGYSHGVKASGTFLAISGQVAWDEKCQIVSEDFVAQFAKALENVVTIIMEAGGRTQNLISLTIFVTQKEEYLDALKSLGFEYRRLMGRHYPAMTLVEVKGLIEPGAKVEIQGMAVL